MMKRSIDLSAFLWDDNGTTHFDVPAFLAAAGYADTPANRDTAAAVFADLARELWPNAVVCDAPPVPFTFYTATCRHCKSTMRIGDARTADQIRRLLESGDAMSSHAFDCPAGWGRAPAAFDVTADAPAGQMLNRDGLPGHLTDPNV